MVHEVLVRKQCEGDDGRLISRVAYDRGCLQSVGLPDLGTVTWYLPVSVEFPKISKESLLQGSIENKLLRSVLLCLFEFGDICA